MLKASVVKLIFILGIATLDHSTREVQAINEATENTFRCKFKFCKFWLRFWHPNHFKTYVIDPSPT